MSYGSFNISIGAARRPKTNMLASRNLPSGLAKTPRRIFLQTLLRAHVPLAITGAPVQYGATPKGQYLMILPILSVTLGFDLLSSYHCSAACFIVMQNFTRSNMAALAVDPVCVIENA